ncbi:MAG: DUF1697 domain-containing protein [Actinomycetota bacterium]
MTSRWVAFCRGINVGGHRATKDELIAPVVALGHGRVDTFLASGNILFTPAAGDGADPDDLATTIGDALTEALGFPVPTTIRTADEVATLAAATPFIDAELAEVSVGKPQVVLLFDRSPAALATAAAAATERSNPGDRLLPDPDHGAVHWLPADGVSGSGIEPDDLAALFGQTTVRTANTIRRLHKKG